MKTFVPVEAWRLVVVGLVALLGSATAADPTDLRGLTYSHLQRTNPRPLQIHVLKVDLQEPSLALRVEVRPDPDGSGPADTTLAAPLEHGARGGFLAAVNANAWSMIPAPGSTNRPPYVAGGPCDVHGWVVVDGAQRSVPQEGYWSLWFDDQRRAHIGRLSKPVPSTRWAIAGFGGLLQDGMPIPQASEVRHPRTAAGLERSGRFLTLAVIDGRQPGYSEGLSERELAELMQELGCTEALNLDGGGSSILLLRNPAELLSIMNRPSDPGPPRPIPVLFGVQRAAAATEATTRDR